MALTIFGIVFVIGASLSLRFNFMILLPAIALATIYTVGVSIVDGDPIGATMLTIALAAVGLQIGYLFGLVASTAIPSLGVREPNAAVVRKFGLR
jgi:hypothetical protein